MDVNSNSDLFDMLIRTIPGAFCFFDGGNVVRECNDYFAGTIMGADREQIIGKHISSLPVSLPLLPPPDSSLPGNNPMHGTDVRSYDEIIICADGKHRLYNIRCSRMHNRKTGTTGIICVMQDNTENSMLELRLSESEQKFFSVLEQSNDAIILTDNNGRIVEWNPAAETILQLKREYALNHHIWDILYLLATEDKKNQEYYNLTKETFLEFYRNRYANWVNKPDDRLVQLSDGSIRSIRSVMFPIVTGNRFIACAVVSDMTPSGQSQKLAGSISELEAIINKSPAVAVLWANKPGLPVEYVSSNIRQYGFEPEEFYSGSLLFSQVVHKDDLDRVFSEVRSYSNNDRIEFFQSYRIVTKIGSVRYVDVNTWIRRNSSGEISHFEGIMIDVTERKNAENELERLNRLLRLMSTCNLELIRSTDKTDLMMRICQIMVEVGGFNSIWIGLTDEKENLVSFAQWGLDDAMLMELQIRPGDRDYKTSPAGRALSNGSTYIIQDLKNSSDEFNWKKAAVGKGIRSVAAIPFYLGSNSTGVMVINSIEFNSFRQEETNFLNDLAENITYGVSYIDIFYDMKNVEQQLRVSDKKFRSVVQELIDGITISDEEGKIIVWNNAMENILGMAEKEMLNRYIWDFQYEISPNELKSEEHYNKIKSKTIDYLKQGIPNTKSYYERKYQCKGGEQKTIEGSLFSVRTANGFMLVNIIRDITRSKKAEDEIKKLNSEMEVRVIERTMQLEEALRDLKMEVNIRQRMTDELRKAQDETSKALIKEKELVELKNRFISMISHEYRTPLTIILSSTNLVERFNNRKQPEKSQKYITKIKKSVRDLTLLLEDVLMISRSDAGVIRANMIPTDIENLCRESIDDVLSIYDYIHEIQLTKEGNFSSVRTDAIVLKNILINLLTNAIKFSGETPDVKMKLKETEDFYELYVIDNGIGISEEDKGVLFDQFIRGSNAVSIPGTGLGLSIVKRCIDLLGGRVEVESSLGKGSTFVIFLPKL